MGASIDITINAPTKGGFVNPTVGFGKNLAVGYFGTPRGPQGVSLSVGPSIGPPVNLSVPAGNACRVLAARSAKTEPAGRK